MPHINGNPATGDDGASGGSCKTEHPENKPPESLLQEPSWKSAAIGKLDKIKARFPACFVEPQPLKVGIRASIIEAMPELLENDVSQALKFYVTRTRYLERCIEGTPRIDLDGKPAGVVTASEAANAEQRLANRRRRRSMPPAPASPPKITLGDLKAAARKRAGA